MAEQSVFYRSLPDAKFVVADDTVWLLVEDPSGRQALVDLSAIVNGHAFDREVIADWCARVRKLDVIATPES